MVLSVPRYNAGRWRQNKNGGSANLRSGAFVAGPMPVCSGGTEHLPRRMTLLIWDFSDKGWTDEDWVGRGALGRGAAGIWVLVCDAVICSFQSKRIHVGP